MITIGVMVTIKYYWSVNCSAMAREWDLILPHSRQTHLARSSFGTNRRHDRDTQTYFREQAVVAGVMVQTMHSRVDQKAQHSCVMVIKGDVYPFESFVLFASPGINLGNLIRQKVSVLRDKLG